LELHARDKAIWDQINPDGETAAPIDEQELEYLILLDNLS